MKITDDRIREIEAADEHAPGGMGLPYVSELLAERKELEKMIERLRVQVERLEGRVDEPCDGCAEKALEAVREVMEHYANPSGLDYICNQCQKGQTDDRYGKCTVCNFNDWKRRLSPWGMKREYNLLLDSIRDILDGKGE